MDNVYSYRPPFITGKAFNKTNTRQLCKLTNAECCHHGFQYQEGLNIDTNPLNNLMCSAGGLYLTFGDCFHKWLYYNYMMMTYIWDVEIPDEAQVFREDDTKIKADRLILTNRRLIKDMKEWSNVAFLEEAHRYNGLSFGGLAWIYNDKPTLQLAMVQYDKSLIKDIKNPTEELQLIAVQSNGRLIEHLKDPSEAVQLAAVQQDGHAISFIPSPSETVQLVAVQQHWSAIGCIPSPSEKVQLATVHQNWEAIFWIRDPTEAVKTIAYRRDR